MGDINTKVGVYKLFGAGDQAKWDRIERALDAGRDVLSMGGEIERLTLLGGSDITVTSTLTALTGLVLPPITYLGGTLMIELDLPWLQGDTLGQSVNFQIQEASGTPVAVGASGFHEIEEVARAYSMRARAFVPIPTHFPLTVGQVLNFRVAGVTTSGTVSIKQSGFNVALGVGTQPITFRAVQQ